MLSIGKHKIQTKHFIFKSIVDKSVIPLHPPLGKGDSKIFPSFVKRDGGDYQKIISEISMWSKL